MVFSAVFSVLLSFFLFFLRLTGWGGGVITCSALCTHDHAQLFCSVFLGSQWRVEDLGFPGGVFFGLVLGTFWASTGHMGFQVSGYKSFVFFSGYRSFGFFGHLRFRVSGQDLLG